MLSSIRAIVGATQPRKTYPQLPIEAADTSASGLQAAAEERGFPEGDRGERSEEHTSELQSLRHLVCRLLLEKKKTAKDTQGQSRGPARPPTYSLRSYET